MSNKVLAGLVATAMLIIVGCASTGMQTIKLPDEDPNFLYAVGMGESANLQLAIDKASTNARVEIGRQLTIKVENLMKVFLEEVGDTDPELSEFSSSTTKTVVSTEMMGSKVKDQKYLQKGGKYQARVLVEYPIGAANASLVDQMKKNRNMYDRFRASESFKELEAEVEKYEQYKKEKEQM
ncbi:MAG: hypothetical protein SCK70_09420 [bacterium]|nr:hypothetical protein [bacterium]